MRTFAPRILNRITIMSIFTKLFGKKTADKVKVCGMEDFLTLIRVYYQAVMASSLGITNINMLPDLAVFKRTLKVPTQNNKLGLAEKSRCKKMLSSIYGINDNFFKEIDSSIKKNCRTLNDVNGYFFQFQKFNESLMMLVGNLMKWRFRTPGFMKKALYAVTEQTVSDILTKNKWKDDATYKTVAVVRQLQQTLGYSATWMTDFVYNIVRLAKKEKAPKQVEEKK